MSNMKSKLPIFAIIAVSSQLTLAEAANDAQFEATTKVTEERTAATEVVEPAEAADKELPPIANDIGSSLQTLLEAKLAIDSEISKSSSEPEFASTH